MRIVSNNAMVLAPSALRVLANARDAFVPSVKGEKRASDFSLRSATQLGVDQILAEIVETRLPFHLRLQFHRLLGILDSRFYNLLLTGRAVKSTDLDDARRAEYPSRWRDNRIVAKRTVRFILQKFGK